MNPHPLPDKALRLLHLGDSYTIGEGVAMDSNWPNCLMRSLQSFGYRIEDSRIIAQTGWTTGDLLQALTKADLQSNWDLVTLCIGVNNQYQGLPIDEYQKELNLLIDIGASVLSPRLGQLCILSIPDWSVSPFAIDRDRDAVQSDVDRFNNTANQTANTRNVAFIDWTPLTRSFRAQEDSFAEDGLHPGSLQYKEWAEFLFEGLIPANSGCDI